jgi:hypothetical protein
MMTTSTLFLYFRNYQQRLQWNNCHQRETHRRKLLQGEVHAWHRGTCQQQQQQQEDLLELVKVGCLAMELVGLLAHLSAEDWLALQLDWAKEDL